MYRNVYPWLLLILPLCLPAQTSETEKLDWPMYRSYRSQAYTLGQQRADSTLLFTSRSIVQQETKAQSMLRAPVDSWEELTIPLVFHVLYSRDQDKVTEQQLLEQIEILNEDFAAAGVPKEDSRDPEGHFRALATDTRIRFCRAATTPGGALTTAVNFKKTPMVAFSSEGVEEAKRSIYDAAPWDAKRYLNVWIVPQGANVAGYAQMPGARGATDGIVIDPKYFGVGGTAVAPFDGGKTLTHLIGNYLGLSELWSEDACGDDGVDDTPVHNGPNFGIPGSGHVSTCDGYPLEMTMNFMDNTDDVAQYMFTRGQAARMRSVLLPGGLRAGLASTLTQCAPDLPLVPLMMAAATRSPGDPFETVRWADLSVSPNPSAGETTVALTFPEGASEGQLFVYNALGSKVYESVLTAPRGTTSIRHELDLTKWVPGAYLVSVRTGGRQLAQRLVVR
jgi:hypothetical protein